MASCQDFINSLYEYASDELPQDTREALTEHLSTCPTCRGELRQYELVIQLAQKLSGISPPHHLLSRFRAAVQSTELPPPEG
jgi:anti-sigma factor RsiW